MTTTITQEDIDVQSWYHGMNFGSLVSKGHLSPENWSIYGVLSFMEGIDFHDLCVLDVGAMDGLTSFIAEREGARYVAATDLYERKTFYMARDILKSRVEYHPRTSIEHLVHRFGKGNFDVVIMAGHALPCPKSSQGDAHSPAIAKNEWHPLP